MTLTRLKSGVLLCGVMMLGACVTENGVSSNGKAPVRFGAAQGEPIPASQRNRQGRETEVANDPLKAHLLAKRDVDPVHVNKKNRYTKNVAELDVAALKGDGSGNFRAFKLEPKLDDNKPLKAALDKVRDKEVSAKAANKIAPAAGMTKASVTNVRTGQYPNKTRLVLDVNSKASFETSFRDGGKSLVVNLPDVHWGAELHESFSRHPLIQSYQVKKGSAETQFIVSLKKPGRLASKMALSPNTTYTSHRIVLDIAPL